MEIRRLGADDLHDVVAAIDRSEHVELQYEVVDGALRERPVAMADIPPWLLDGDGEHTVSSYVTAYGPLVRDGAALFVAFDDDGSVQGAAIVDPVFEPPMAWFALLHVSRPHRRKGVAAALWEATAEVARSSGATSMYVSATSTGSAVGFYLSRGARLADPPHAALFAQEPVDIHLVAAL